MTVRVTDNWGGGEQQTGSQETRTRPELGWQMETGRLD